MDRQDGLAVVQLIAENFEQSKVVVARFELVDHPGDLLLQRLLALFICERKELRSLFGLRLQLLPRLDSILQPFQA